MNNLPTQMTYEEFISAMDYYKKVQLELLHVEYENKSGLQSMYLAQTKELERIHRSNELAIIDQRRK